jgi:hypothetical protein
MQWFRDYQGREVRLTDERLAHILEGHPELIGFESAIRETIVEPDTVAQSTTNPIARLYYRWYEHTSAGANYLCVVIIMLENDAFVASAYLRGHIRRGTILWTRPQ